MTWNCCRGAFAKKAPLLAELAADVAVIQECAKPDSESPQRLWLGDNPRQGIAVITSGPFSLERLAESPDVPKYMYPIRVHGPQAFNLLAVWSKGGQTHPYIEGVVKGVACYRDLIASAPTLVAGDLNSNAIWDNTHPPSSNHSALVRQMSELGSTSCYHQFFDEAHGAESQPTYYFHWKRERPFHIDYCFAPESWTARISKVEVGGYDDWRDHSDHRPLMVEFSEDVG